MNRLLKFLKADDQLDEDSTWSAMKGNHAKVRKVMDTVAKVFESGTDPIIRKKTLQCLVVPLTKKRSRTVSADV